MKLCELIRTWMLVLTSFSSSPLCSRSLDEGFGQHLSLFSPEEKKKKETATDFRYESHPDQHILKKIKNRDNATNPSYKYIDMQL